MLFDPTWATDNETGQTAMGTGGIRRGLTGQMTQTLLQLRGPATHVAHGTGRVLKGFQR